MSDVEIKARSLEEVWETIVKSTRRSWREAEGDRQFYGIFEGQMSALAILAIFMGKTREYISLCQELEGMSWTFDEKEHTYSGV